MSEQTSAEPKARQAKQVAACGQAVGRAASGERAGAAPKVDRRILFTKGLIKEAFLELKKSSALADIKVTDLCERAGIGRGTFYRHYRNTTEVLDEVLDDALSQSSSLARHLVSREMRTAGACLGCDMPFCQFVREDKRYSGIFLDESLTRVVLDKMVESQKGVYLRAMRGICDLSEGELADLLYFQSSGCLSAVRRCINASPEEWARTQAVIDNFILGGLAVRTRRL